VACFTNTLLSQLQLRGVTADACITAVSAVDDYVDAITHAVRVAIEKHVPKTRPSPFSKRWWTPELAALRRAYANAVAKSSLPAAREMGAGQDQMCCGSQHLQLCTSPHQSCALEELARRHHGAGCLESRPLRPKTH